MKKGNLPVSLVVDELATFFIYQLDTLIATARENMVAVLLAFQDLLSWKDVRETDRC
ncbi:hypothetical protein [Persicobacter diffluens]|uniref:TraD/TraG TraM recognition site domain-containing protein n=1 Tax=Persicobacter diffluens TaxID=981 RepID=A0AAN4W4Q0_9BACT|nr:hypothetical protein PEDI_50670 [Persicobacter diffluens]